jgi:hypothetical protein
MRTLLVVLAVLAVPGLALAEEATAPTREHVLPPTYVHPRAPVHVFVARSRTERPLEEMRARFTDEIVATASSEPF